MPGKPRPRPRSSGRLEFRTVLGLATIVLYIGFGDSGFLLPTLSGAVPESKSSGRPLRVVTYNLLHDGAGSGFVDGRTHLEERLEMTIQELKALDPDIIAVQEASDSRLHGNVAERLATALGFHVVFAPATEHIFGLRPLDWLVVRVMGFKEGSAILSRFPIAASAAYELPRCKKRLEPRIMLHATLSTTRGPIDVFSAHTGRGDECQIARVGEIVRDRLSAGPSLLMGDFNTAETSQVMVTLRNEAGFIDAFRAANPETNGPTVWQRIDSLEPTVSRRVDFVFLVNGRSSKASVRSSRVVLDRPRQFPDGSALWPSDHHGVLAEFDLEAANESR
jgi:endonuclease/exonuclease/phosphatase family metal-dependent hydrolase